MSITKTVHIAAGIKRIIRFDAETFAQTGDYLAARDGGCGWLLMENIKSHEKIGFFPTLKATVAVVKSIR